MDFLLSAAQAQYKDEVARFAKNNLCVQNEDAGFSRELWEKLSAFGLFSLAIEEAQGGLGEGYLTAAVAYEALGYGCDNNGLTFAATNHVWVALNMIALYGSSFLKSRYVAPMMSGEKIGCFALTEAESGSDALCMGTRCKAKDGGYILNGNKMFLSNGPIADVFLVIAGEETAGQYSCFVLERGFPGLSCGPAMEKMGLEGCPMCELILENCHVPAENLLGRPGLGYGLMIAALEWERIFEFAPHVGAMRRIAQRCAAYATQRRQHGHSIGEYDAIAHKIADMRTATDAARLMLYQAAWLKDQGGSAFMQAAAFELFTSEQYVKVCRDAMQIFGAYGYATEYGIEREMRDALACTIYSGTSEMQRNTIYGFTSKEPGLWG